MSRYIDFTTSPNNPYVGQSGGAIHNNELPRYRTPKGIRIDNEPIVFKDEALHEKLYHALRTAEQLQARSAIIDCLAFIALMQGSNLGEPRQNGLFFLHPTTEPRHISSHDIENDLPVNIGHSYHGQVRYVHSLYPAHLPHHAFYIHKLGDNEPVCLSTLDQAHHMKGTVVAHPMPELRVGASN